MTTVFTDRLDALLDHFPVHARLFHSGALCGVTQLGNEKGVGQLHLIHSGPLKVHHTDGSVLHITQPSLLLYSSAVPRQFITDPHQPAELVCADLHFEGESYNPIVQALPPCLCIALRDLEGIDQVLALLFDEAFNDKCGRRAIVDRIFEIILIQVLRYVMEEGQVNSGMLAGLAHPKLRNALVAMHERPAEPWSLDQLAQVCVMSRSLFASAFRNTVGCTPGNYLQAWRIRLAQKALHQNTPLKMIAAEVGYGSEAALSRAFKSHSGMTPRQWKDRAQDPHAG
jgi:AraC-like DNA-binding protein